jgi:hypothetical protein
MQDKSALVTGGASVSDARYACGWRGEAQNSPSPT